MYDTKAIMVRKARQTQQLRALIAVKCSPNNYFSKKHDHKLVLAKKSQKLFGDEGLFPRVGKFFHESVALQETQIFFFATLPIPLSV